VIYGCHREVFVLERLVLILEDDLQRMERFGAVLGGMDRGLRMVVWRSARVMVREVEGYLGRAVLVSLDHDLYVAAGEEEPGDGVEVARFLAERRVGCPVIVHSSNAEGARRMVGELELEGCVCRVVLPLGAEWVEVYWGRVVRELLGIHE
jgi:hypothetical protein